MGKMADNLEKKDTHDEDEESIDYVLKDVCCQLKLGKSDLDSYQKNHVENYGGKGPDDDVIDFCFCFLCQRFQNGFQDDFKEEGSDDGDNQDRQKSQRDILPDEPNGLVYKIHLILSLYFY